jgi:succinyl-diaminopimelate desuccinylase
MGPQLKAWIGERAGRADVPRITLDSSPADRYAALATMPCIADTALLRAQQEEVTHCRRAEPLLDDGLLRVIASLPPLALPPSDHDSRLHARFSWADKAFYVSAGACFLDPSFTAWPLLTEMRALTARPREIDGLTYWQVTSVTKAWDGGRGQNVIPDLFMLNVNHRFAADTSIAEACEFVRSLVRGRARVEFTDLSPAAPPRANSPLVRALEAAGVHGIHPMQAWTDVARFAELGVPAVNFGPGEYAQAHRKNESTSLALLHEGYDIVVRWLMSLG